MRKAPKIYIKFIYDKNYFVVYNNDEIVDDNNGKGYLSKTKAMKKIKFIEKRELNKYKNYLNKINDLINAWFMLNQHFFVLCQEQEYKLKMEDQVFDLFQFEKIMNTVKVSTPPVDIKLLFKYFKHGMFLINMRPKKEKEKRHHSANYKFNKFMINFNKNVKLKKAMVDKFKSN